MIFVVSDGKVSFPISRVVNFEKPEELPSQYKDPEKYLDTIVLNTWFQENRAYKECGRTISLMSLSHSFIPE